MNNNDAEIILDPISATKGEYAGFLIRLIAFLADFLIIAVIYLIIIAIPLFILKSDVLFIFLASMVIFVVSWLYESLFLSSKWMATPGKMLVGLKVNDMNGNRISFSRATLRYTFKNGLNCLYFIPCIDVLGLLCLVSPFIILFTDKKQALHDLIAGTVVICT